MLHAALLNSEDLFKANTFHISLHGSKDKVTRARLQSLVGLLADENLAGRAF